MVASTAAKGKERFIQILCEKARPKHFSVWHFLAQIRR